MHTVKVDLSENLTKVYIDILSDLHIGDPLCDLENVKARINKIAKNEECYAILNGDLLNMALKDSKSDVYSSFSPMEELELLIELLAPIKDKILCVQTGNHENRTVKSTNIDTTRLVCKQFGIEDRYDPISNVVFLRFGKDTKRGKEMRGKSTEPCYRKHVYSIYCRHTGGSGGRRVGSKLNGLHDMSMIVDADIFITGHTHMPAIFKSNRFVINKNNSCVTEIEQMFINTGAELNYGGYGEEKNYSPLCRKTPIIKLGGVTRSIEAYL